MDRFARFKQRVESSILSCKPELEVTIYGSYYPAEEKKRLEKLRDFLRSDGYDKAKLVDDYPNGMDPLNKSRLCLQFADANFFVFTHRGKGQGATNELTFVCGQLLDRVWRCVVFVEKVNGVLATSSLNLNMVRFKRMDTVEFKSDTELLELARAKAFEYVRNLYIELMYRI